MIYTAPHYYKKFRCIAGDCQDTCCAGWQIMIDETSMKRYERTGGGLGNRLHNSIDRKQGCFKQYGGRCAFLNEEHLCDLYAEGGPGMLCKTCREYPRHTEEFEGCREISLSLSCEEAARIILGTREPVRFITKERPGEETYPDFDFFLYTKLADSRELMIRILQNRELPASLRLSMALALAHDLQGRICREELFAADALMERYGAAGAPERFAKKLQTLSMDDRERYGRMREMFGLFDELEVLKSDWPDYIGGLRRALYDRGPEAYAENRRQFLAAHTKEGDDRLAVWTEQLAVYFVFTYYCGAVYDGRAYEKIQLAVVSTLLILEMAQAVWQLRDRPLELSDISEATHRYSREIEHSDDNLRALERLFAHRETFKLNTLLGLTGGQ